MLSTGKLITNIAYQTYNCNVILKELNYIVFFKRFATIYNKVGFQLKQIPKMGVKVDTIGLIFHHTDMFPFTIVSNNLVNSIHKSNTILQEFKRYRLWAT